MIGKLAAEAYSRSAGYAEDAFREDYAAVLAAISNRMHTGDITTAGEPGYRRTDSRAGAGARGTALSDGPAISSCLGKSSSTDFFLQAKFYPLLVVKFERVDHSHAAVICP